MTTIKEIAAYVNVSQTTVSKVLKQDPSFSVSEITRQRIYDAAKELNYRPKKIVQLSNERSINNKKIAIISVASEKDELCDLFWASVRTSIESNCQLMGLHDVQLMRRKFVDFELLKTMDGIFVLGTIDLDQLVPRITEHTQVVLVNHSHAIYDFDRVSISFESAVEKVLSHFFEQGHYKIGFIGGNQHLESLNSPHVKAILEEPLRRHFGKMMRDKQLYNASYYRECNWSADDGYHTMKSLLQLPNRPTACFIANDPMAIGALKALQEANLHVPQIWPLLVLTTLV